MTMENAGMSERPALAHGAPPDHLGLSLIVPAYNEAQRLEAGCARLQAAVDAGAVDPATTEFIVVDDGSSDDTERCAKELYSTFPHSSVIRLPENRGKGAAVRAGVSAATGRYVAFADADMAIDPLQVPQFLAALEGNDLAIGSRAAKGAAVDRASLRRSVMNRTFNHFVNAVTHLSLDDTQCGFKAFRGPLARLLFHCSTTERMAFDVELLALARIFDLRIAQVPVHWSRVEGSRVRSWSDAGSMIRDVLRARSKLDRSPPLVVAPLAASLTTTDSAVARLATVTPVLGVGQDEYLALFPLRDADGAASLALSFGLDGLTFESMPAARLKEFAPLRLAAPARAGTSRS
jgi:dolichyl-phosphate beta-glucosyltransferase